MSQWWKSLNQREQRSVLAMSVVVVIFIIYSFIWQPINEGIDKANSKITRQQELLQWVEQNLARYKQAQQNPSNASKGSLSSLVNASARQNNISIARIQPQGDNLQVWIEEVPFNQLLAWLETLANSKGIHVKSIDLNKTDIKGVVGVRRLQLGRI